MICNTLSLDEDIYKLAEKLHQKKSLIVMGRGYNYATCLEGALVRNLFIMYNTYAIKCHYKYLTAKFSAAEASSNTVLASFSYSRQCSDWTKNTEVASILC